uniref:RNA-directed DNA polymerase, eukaryota, reverse transcriptase zinc-binding domain protein n=1 Tax=Tanacetum cinerariifolium TaxID=118510 RepID=A0A6L2M290_TANCI|nr:RNA-directed DNA polymerase, eukaryota, reverse transcriptase zinc-binding domain protein [Tanacetum cinerariifolium]
MSDVSGFLLETQERVRSGFHPELLFVWDCINNVEMEDVACSRLFYTWTKNLFKEVQVKQMKNIKMIIKNKLSEAEVNEMVKDAEIKESLELKEDVCKVVKEFFVTRKLLTEINSTVTTLVSKIQSLDKVIDFRPIACCNVLYKCINKIITKRMKKFLGKLVDNNQSAFVPNRHVQDNILSSQELLKGYKRKEGPKGVFMKIDIQKAYDTMN